MKFGKWIKKINEAGFKGLPKGWTEESLKKWMSTFKKNHGKGPKDEGFFDICVGEMSDKMGEDGAKGFCAALKSEAWGTTYWRSGKGKDKSKKEIKKLAKEHPLDKEKE